MEDNKTGLTHPTVWVGVIALTLVSLYVVKLIWWLVLPFLMAGIFYYISIPMIHILMRKGMSHSQAIWAYIGGLSVIFIIIMPFLLPWLGKQAYDLQEKIPTLQAQMQEFGVETLQSMEKRFAWMQKAGVAQKFSEKFDTGGDVWVEEHFEEGILFLMTWVPSLLLVPYLAFFFLRDAATFKRLVMRGIPNAFFEKVLFLFYRIDGQIKQYFRGLMAMTFLDAITLGVGLWLLGLTHPTLFPPGKAMFLGVVCAVLSWVPFVGSIVGCILVVIVCAVEAPKDGLLLMSALILFAVVRLLDDFVYTPATIGRSLSVHPLLTVLMIFAGGVIAGVPGLLLALPVLGICMVLGDVFGQVWFDQRLRARHRYRKKLEQMEAQEDLV